MVPLTVEEILVATGGDLVKGLPESKISGVCIDTRMLRIGDVFIPLVGNTDGHRFVTDALKAGAAGVLVGNNYDNHNKLIESGLFGNSFVVMVEDTLKAFQSIARYYREKLSLKVIAITGSTGKTTTKDMINCVLAQQYKVVSTDKNYNNEIGVPLTILRADETTEALVVEMAMRGRGQIRELAEIAKPDIGVITNIGQAHIELLGSEQAIAEAKSELVGAINGDGVAILNADDLWTPLVSECACSRTTKYGITAGEVRAEKIESDELGRAKFRLIMHEGDAYTVRLPVPGKHNVYNALAASAVGMEMGLGPDQIRIGLSNCRLTSMRMEVFSTVDNVLILNDAYNANPTAMQAALVTLLDVRSEGRHIAILGDMLELGQYGVEAHKQIGEMVASLGIELLITVGNESQIMAESAVRAGMATKNVVTCEDAETAAQLMKQLVEPGDVILVKASRAVGLEAVVKAMVEI
jgi:UDP-N-acetylmuramoyl-tripeptide--D-alanyl-D-alanine ligase